MQYKKRGIYSNLAWDLYNLSVKTKNAPKFQDYDEC